LQTVAYSKDGGEGQVGAYSFERRPWRRINTHCSH